MNLSADVYVMTLCTRTLSWTLSLLSVAAWPAERAADDATQVWVASGYLHHKSLGVPPQSWRHVDYSRWTLGPSTCQRPLQLPSPPSTLPDIHFGSRCHFHWRAAGPSIRVSDHEFLPTILICPSFLKPPPHIFLLSQVFYFILWVHPHHVQCVHPLLSTPLLPSPPWTPRVLAVSVESGSVDSSTLVLSFLLGIVFWSDWTM